MDEHPTTGKWEHIEALKEQASGDGPRKVKILERAETMGDGPTRSERPWGRRYAPILDRVTFCYVRFGCFSWDSAFSPQP